MGWSSDWVQIQSRVVAQESWESSWFPIGIFGGIVGCCNFKEKILREMIERFLTMEIYGFISIFDEDVISIGSSIVWLCALCLWDMNLDDRLNILRYGILILRFALDDGINYIALTRSCRSYHFARSSTLRVIWTYGKIIDIVKWFDWLMSIRKWWQWFDDVLCDVHIMRGVDEILFCIWESACIVAMMIVYDKIYYNIIGCYVYSL